MNLPLVANIFICAGLVAFSATFSGLTLGLLSLDTVDLQILCDVGQPNEQQYAMAILPIRKKGNLLLCTLLVGNTIVNSFLSIFLADLSSGVIGLLISTMLIVLFGEIAPQATCTRHGLMIGAKTIFMTRFFMTIFLPITWPISRVLDWVLGQEVGTVYNRHELKRLIELHAEHPDALVEAGITKDERNMLTGALEYSHKVVSDVMTTIDNVYMIEASTKLDFDTMLDIYKCGYTRIPVYESLRQNIIGILYAKDLILVDPDDEMEVRAIIAFNGRLQTRFVLDSTPLNEVMALFQKSHIHLMVAVKLMTTFDELNGLSATAGVGQEGGARLLDVPQAMRRVTGIISLEDVLEEVIKAEIVDEHDTFVANNKGARVRTARGDVSKYLELFSHKMRENTRLSPGEVQAVTAYLTSAVPEFKPLKGYEAVIKGLVRNSAVIDLDVEAGWDSEEERNEDEVELPEALGEVKHGRLLLYKRETPAELFTLVLQGEVQVAAGEEGFTSTQGPWSYLGSSALRAGMVYVPDYTAYAMGPCRLVQISRAQFAAALKAGQVQTVVGARTIKKMASSGADKAGTRADGSMGFSLGGQLHAVGHSRFMPQHLQAARGEGPGTRAYDGGEVGTTPEEVSVSVTPDGGSGEAGSPDGQRRWDPTWVRSADRQSEGDEGARQSVAGVGGRRTPEGRAGRSDVELVRQGDADSVDGGSHHSANSNWME